MLSIDDKIIMAVNGEYPKWIDQIMILLSDRFIWIPLYILLAILVVRKLGWKYGLIMLAACGIAIGVTDWVCASVIRPWVSRLRPLDPNNPVSEYLRVIKGVPRSYSFPSCHAANTFALVAFMSLIFRSWKIFLILSLWALLVCLSRLYLGVHYFTDLLGGALIGSAISSLVYFLAKKIRLKPIKVVLIMGFCILSAPVKAEKVKFEWGGQFAAIFDNREGSAHHTPAETYFLTRLAPEVGLSIDSGHHRIMAGAVWIQPIGCEWDGHRVSPTVYYRYMSERWRASMGMFPRTQLLKELPEYISSDSTRYFQHNLRGALFQYAGKEGFAELLCDWRGMQSSTRREAFAVIAQGEWERKLLRAGGTAMLNHLALAKGAKGQYVVDNIIANPYVGLNFMPLISPSAKFHQLELNIGFLTSLTRDRKDMNWLSSFGLRAKLIAHWWRISLNNIFAVNNRPLFPLYSRHGSVLSEGEPYYASKLYNRTELSGLLFSYRNIVLLKAELDFHVTPGDFMFYQRLILTLKI